MRKKIIALLFVSQARLFAQDAPATATPALPPQVATKTQSYMMIDPKARANDYQQAFEMLRQEKTSNKIYFQMGDGTMISNIIEMTILNNGTLILLRYNSPQGLQLEIVGTEDIATISYQ